MDDDKYNNSNNSDWFNTGPWYNKNICSVLHGIKFEDFITQARTDRYNIMCSLVSHNRLQNDYKDDEISIGDRAIPNYATVKELNALGAIFNFIDIWIKLLRENYFDRSESYSIYMEEMFKQVPKNVERALTSREKKSKIDYRYWGWMVFEKCEKGIPPLKRKKLSKKAQERHDLILKKTL